MAATVQGAEYGSIIPGAGTLLGAGIGSLFGGKGSPGPTDADHMRDVQAAINQDYQSIFGRAPTQVEMASAVPYYWAGGPGGSGGRQTGMAYVANLYQQQQNTPEAIYQQQQQQYLNNAPQYSQQVSQVFQSALGRAPTQDELSHFGALMASGQDAYQVQQALQQTQEYQNTQNTNFQNQLQGQLQQSNATYFNQYIAPQLQAQNAMSGQAPGSTALSAQLSQAALQQNQGLQNFLAGVTAQNYQNSTANATNQYNQLMGQQYGLQNANVSNALQNNAYNQQWGNQLALYNQQQQAYNNYLSQYGKRSGLQGIGSLAGGLLGAGIGAFSTHTPQGAMAGYQIGSGAGGGIGALL